MASTRARAGQRIARARVSPRQGLFLAFDYGSRRIGIAVGEARLGRARPLSVVNNVNGTPDWQAIDRLMSEWDPTALVVGWPLTLSGEEQALNAHVRGFIRRLRSRYDRPVHQQDERFSSTQAEIHMQAMRASGQRRKRSTHEDIDKLAAAVILESWFSNDDSELDMSTTVPATHYDQSTVTGWLDTMLQTLRQCSDGDNPAVIGIRRGGVDVARYLHEGLSLSTPLGELNIAFYRDDFSSIGLHPVVGPSHVPFDVEGRHIILVDDVLGTGRTVRAAMNEIFDYGRPAKITLAVLVERSDHELPIRADVTGHRVSVEAHQHVCFDAEGMTVQLETR